MYAATKKAGSIDPFGNAGILPSGSVSRRQFSLATLFALALPGCGGSDGTPSDASTNGVSVSVETALLGKADDQGITEWELEAAKRALANLKELLYGAPMLQLIGAEIEQSDAKIKQYIAASGGKFNQAQVIVRAKGVKSAPFFSVLRSILAISGTADQVRNTVLHTAMPMHPEHYAYLDGGGAVETMGGLPTRTYPASTTTPPDFVAQYIDKSYTTVLSGSGPLKDGTPFTYVLQQFKDTDDGMEGNLRIWYPAGCPANYLEEHSKHYAVEFRNGLHLAAAAQNTSVAVSVETALVGKADEKGIDEWELEAAKRALANLKGLLYGDPMLKLIGAEIEASDAQIKQYIAASNGKFIPAQVIVRAKGVKSVPFFTTLRTILAISGTPDQVRETVLNVAMPMHPEHYAYLDKGGAVETMGGLPTRTYPASLQTPPDFVAQYIDKSYTTVLAGAGPLQDGTPFTYVLQQFKDTDDGLEANLRIWYPAGCPAIYLEEHSKHYAVEFRNGIRLTAANQKS